MPTQMRNSNETTGKNKCALCDKPISPKAEMLCDEHLEAAKRQTKRLKADYESLLYQEAGKVWGPDA